MQGSRGVGLKEPGVRTQEERREGVSRKSGPSWSARANLQTSIQYILQEVAESAEVEGSRRRAEGVRSQEGRSQEPENKKPAETAESRNGKIAFVTGGSDRAMGFQCSASPAFLLSPFSRVYSSPPNFRFNRS